jgi:hypothetical protein
MRGMQSSKKRKINKIHLENWGWSLSLLVVLMVLGVVVCGAGGSGLFIVPLAGGARAGARASTYVDGGGRKTRTECGGLMVVMMVM